MPKTNKLLRAMGIAVPVALMIMTADAKEVTRYWNSASGKAWVSGSGECWTSLHGPNNLPPCVSAPKKEKEKEIIDSYTINLVNDEFDFDKYFLKPDMKVALDDLARRVKASPGDEMLTIIGHTDSKGSEQYNYGLGLRRANSTKEYLVKVGKLDPNKIRVESKGELQPVASNATEEGRAQNRRIEIVADDFKAPKKK